MKGVATITITFLVLFFSQQAFAQEAACEQIFGGGDTCLSTAENIGIGKTIQDPQTKQFIDGFLQTDRPFTPESTLTFQIRLTNTSNTKINKIDLTDTLPQYLTFVKGPGAFDKDTKTVTFSVENLNADQSQSFLITARVNTGESIPSSLTCLANQVTAQVAGRNQKAQDNVQFCIARTQGVFPSPIQAAANGTTKGLSVAPPPAVTQIPNTGPQMLGVIGLIPTGIAGYFLRRKTKRK